MKKFILSMLLSVLALGLISPKVYTDQTEVIFSTIPPIKYLIDRITENTSLSSESIIERGQDPHNFELKPSLIKKLEKAKLYFAVGMGGTEEILLEKIKTTYPNLKIVNISEGIEKIKTYAHHKHNHDSDHDSDKENLIPSYDPHIWNSPKNMKKIAENIYNTIKAIYPQYEKTFESNYRRLISDLDNLDKEVSKILSPYKGKKFLVYHSAFKYFEKDYGVKEISIEYEGKEATPKMIQEILEIAKKENIKIIFVQIGFSTKSANIIAESVKAKVEEINPIDYDYINNIRNIAQKIAESYK
ncbi:MAG: metal ABC transporter solute-binding protein, Zn/Mn family [Brevinematia bacterium]